MLPVNQLCSWLPIMLLATNYAQNYASIIGKGLAIGTSFSTKGGVESGRSPHYTDGGVSENSLLCCRDSRHWSVEVGRRLIQEVRFS